jgi:hypothetical protein
VCCQMRHAGDGRSRRCRGEVFCGETSPSAPRLFTASEKTQPNFSFLPASSIDTDSGSRLGNLSASVV